MFQTGTSALGLLLSAGLAAAQAPSASLPAMAPTQGIANGTTAPVAATGGVAPQPGAAGHAAEVSCANGQLTIHAENSSLNQILRAVSRCTGMRITGRVGEQRVFGNYGPAEPATVLATLLDGTGSNMLLHETAENQPAELILTPRTGGPTPPSAMAQANSDDEDDDTPRQPPAPNGQNMYRPGGQRFGGRPNLPPNGQGGNSQANGGAVTGPQQIPQPTNNPLGSPNNTSPTASTYPTTNSVPLDSVNTPSSVNSPNGIVDAPNPPPAGSDTAAVLNGAAQGTPGTTNISPDATGQTSTPGGTNTTVPDNNNGGSQLTPEQIFQQLQQRQQQEQQQQQQGNSPQ